MEHIAWLLQILRDPAWGSIGVLMSIPLAFLAGRQAKSENVEHQEHQTPASVAEEVREN